ncbi:hypothetical protein PTSG_04135 [Salpingoeca rosetta]|uniref:Uncharacterized protein n=1 Tax=Salpingoeca rosetta (strain ATCC 50818 / BSB-021) TaxID=946362 RepID=F2U6P4_SALR5|nr:uncharacterized protein PTSG_04135 [Salpingoeca rosetta]EGD83526.1 hypothetical protein PTSG_04135 [Salpingoeca rosetta]|eukprot:XP_004995030.1 hypothetical protein PTSG_04135 [Salpingoeca rosetta]
MSATTAKRTHARDVVIAASKKAKWTDLSTDTKDFTMQTLRRACSTVTSTLRSTKARTETKELTLSLRELCEQRLSEVQGPPQPRRALANVHKSLLTQEMLLAEACQRLDTLKQAHEKEAKAIEETEAVKAKLEVGIKRAEDFHTQLHKSRLHPAVRAAVSEEEKALRSTSATAAREGRVRVQPRVVPQCISADDARKFHDMTAATSRLQQYVRTVTAIFALLDA